MIITVANQKGGCGKTTVATNLAVAFAHDKKKVLLIDGDIQGSSMAFREDRQSKEPVIQTVQITTGTIHEEVKGFNHDVIIIDAGGRDSKAFRSALFAADIVIFPLRPSQTDIYSTETTLELFNEVRSIKEIPGAMLLNQVITNPMVKITSQVDELLHDIADSYKVKTCKTKMYARLAYIEAIARGISVIEEKDEKFEKAAEEIQNLKKEILSWSKHKSK